MKERINISNVDTGDRNCEGDNDEAGEAIEEALSPFINVNRTSLPFGGLSKPNRDSNLLGGQDSLAVFDEDTTGESPFSSPRVFGEKEVEIEKEPELIELKEEVKENRVSFLKSALGLGNIGTLEESYAERDDETEPTMEAKTPATPAMERKLEIEKQFSEYQFKEQEIMNKFQKVHQRLSLKSLHPDRYSNMVEGD